MAKYWRNIDSLYSSGGPTFLSTCYPNVPWDGNSYQNPKSGQSYGGGGFLCQPPQCSSTGNRQYFRNRLKSTLLFGKIYCVKFYVNIRDISTYGIDGFGAYFGDSSIDTITKTGIPLTYIIPQVQNPNNNIITDTMNWTLVTGTFVANGTEKHCIIGNFKSDATTNKILINPTNLPTIGCDILIDDVSCIPLDLPAYAAPGSDIWAIPGNTVYLGRPQDVGIDEACEWFQLPNTTSVIANAAGLTLTVAPTTNTYMVKQTICGIVNYDTVVVHASGVGNVEWQMLNDKLTVYPNPVNEILNIELAVFKETEFKLKIFNNLNQVIREEVLRQAQQPNGNLTFQIKTDELKSGIYFLSLTNNLGSVSKRFVISR